MVMVTIAFAFLAGLATILAPCILPILPIVLTAGSVGGSRRPWGVLLGVVISFSLLTLTLAWLVRQFNVSPNLGRTIGIVILFLLGLIMLVPSWLARLEGWLSSQLSRWQPRTQGRGFVGGVVLGLSLGAVWSPCAGPILVSVVTAVQTNAITTSIVFTTLAYALGAAIPMSLILFFGQQLVRRLRWLNRHAALLQRIFGGVVVVMAIAMIFNLDRQWQNWAIGHTPSWLPAQVQCGGSLIQYETSTH